MTNDHKPMTNDHKPMANDHKPMTIMTFSCYIIDDEPIAIDIIRRFVQQLPQFEVKGSFEDPAEAFMAIKSDPADLIFLDIQMPGLTGIELLKTLSHPPEVIFTTAYREFAIEGYELNVLDYLLKPIAFNRFLQAIEKFLEKKKAQKQVRPQDQEDIFVRADRKVIRIRLEEILYIEGMKDYIRIFLKDRNIVTKELISQIEKRLPTDQFMRIHRSFIVARDKIDAYTAHDVEIGRYEIPVGRKYKEAFMRKIKG